MKIFFLIFIFYISFCMLLYPKQIKIKKNAKNISKIIISGKKIYLLNKTRKLIEEYGFNGKKIKNIRLKRNSISNLSDFMLSGNNFYFYNKYLRYKSSDKLIMSDLNGKIITEKKIYSDDFSYFKDINFNNKKYIFIKTTSGGCIYDDNLKFVLYIPVKTVVYYSDDFLIFCNEVINSQIIKFYKFNLNSGVIIITDKVFSPERIIFYKIKNSFDFSNYFYLIIEAGNENKSSTIILKVSKNGKILNKKMFSYKKNLAVNYVMDEKEVLYSTHYDSKYLYIKKEGF